MKPPDAEELREKIHELQLEDEAAAKSPETSQARVSHSSHLPDNMLAKTTKEIDIRLVNMAI